MVALVLIKKKVEETILRRELKRIEGEKSDFLLGPIILFLFSSHASEVAELSSLVS